MKRTWNVYNIDGPHADGFHVLRVKWNETGPIAESRKVVSVEKTVEDAKSVAADKQWVYDQARRAISA